MQNETNVRHERRKTRAKLKVVLFGVPLGAIHRVGLALDRADERLALAVLVRRQHVEVRGQVLVAADRTRRDPGLVVVHGGRVGLVAQVCPQCRRRRLRPVPVPRHAGDGAQQARRCSGVCQIQCHGDVLGIESTVQHAGPTDELHQPLEAQASAPHREVRAVRLRLRRELEQLLGTVGQRRATAGKEHTIDLREDGVDLVLGAVVRDGQRLRAGRLQPLHVAGSYVVAPVRVAPRVGVVERRRVDAHNRVQIDGGRWS